MDREIPDTNLQQSYFESALVLQDQMSYLEVKSMEVLTSAVGLGDVLVERLKRQKSSLRF